MHHENANHEDATVEPLTEAQNDLGEGPLWDPQGRLFWTDINARRLYLWDPATGEETAKFSVKVGCIGLRESGGLVLATDGGFALLPAQEGLGGAGLESGETGLEFLGDPEADLPQTRFNDGAVDPGGRFWAGSYGGESNSLYRLDVDGSVHKIDTGFGIPNGTDWSLDGKTMYFTDSTAKTIYAYDFDVQTGAVENRRPFIVTEEDGVPDGLTVDAEGFLWSARWGGWRVERYDPEGRLERTLTLPVSQPTSCAFGGDGLGRTFCHLGQGGVERRGVSRAAAGGAAFSSAARREGARSVQFWGVDGAPVTG